MLLRRIVGVFAVLVILAGLAEIIFPNFAIDLSRTMTRLLWLRVAGAFSIVFGVLLIVAYLQRAVEIRVFVLVLGIYAIVAGLVVIAGPDLIRDLVYALLIRRGPGFQCAVLWVTGLIRIAIGCALIYALLKTPRIKPTQ